MWCFASVSLSLSAGSPDFPARQMRVGWALLPPQPPPNPQLPRKRLSQPQSKYCARRSAFSTCHVKHKFWKRLLEVYPLFLQACPTVMPNQTTSSATSSGCRLLRRKNKWKVVAEKSNRTRCFYLHPPKKAAARVFQHVSFRPLLTVGTGTWVLRVMFVPRCRHNRKMNRIIILMPVIKSTLCLWFFNIWLGRDFQGFFAPRRRQGRVLGVVFPFGNGTGS